jgi:hypothetical protein
MSQICITPEQEIAIKEAVKNGDFSLSKLQETKSSSERLELVNKFIGNEDVSKKVVRDIETRLGSKREDIVENYINRTMTSVPSETRKGVFNKFKRMQKLLGAEEDNDFMEELVAHKFGAYITKEEANKFEKLTIEAAELRDKIPAGVTDITDESREYGAKLVELENTESKLVLDRTGFDKADFKKFKDQKGFEKIASWSKYLATGAAEASGATRAFKATGDVSATFRQLWKIFSSGLTESAFSLGKNNDKLKIWANSLKTTLEAVKETSKYGDERVYDAVRAEIHAHPNSYNGVFDTASNKFGLRAGVEEQFPSSIPTDTYDKFVSKKGNLFKISEVAFNSTVLKARFDLANLTIDTIKKGGGDIMDKKTADAAGEFVSAFTGRASLGAFEKAATVLNKFFFAPRFAASQFSPYNQIIQGFTTKADNPAARLAAKDNIQFLVGSFGLAIAAESARSFIEGEKPDYTSVVDPRSNRFGKVTIPGSHIGADMTGGNRSVIGLFNNMASKKYYDSRLGIWREKSIFQTIEGKPLWDFASGKFAPVPSLLRDLKKGEHFGGKEVSAASIVSNLLMPITVANVLEEGWQKEDMSSAMIVLATEGSGFGVSDIRFKPQNDEWKALLNTNEKAYWEAVGELWVDVHSELKELRADEKFQSLPRQKQTDKVEKLYKKHLSKVLRQDKYKDVLKDKLKEIKDERKESIL